MLSRGDFGRSPPSGAFILRAHHVSYAMLTWQPNKQLLLNRYGTVGFADDMVANAAGIVPECWAAAVLRKRVYARPPLLWVRSNRLHCVAPVTRCQKALVEKKSRMGA